MPLFSFLFLFVYVFSKGLIHLQRTCFFLLFLYFLSYFCFFPFDIFNHHTLVHLLNPASPLHSFPFSFAVYSLFFFHFKCCEFPYESFTKDIHTYSFIMVSFPLTFLLLSIPLPSLPVLSFFVRIIYKGHVI